MARTLKYPDTICWECKNAVGGCSWSRELEPVDGWQAIPTKIKANGNNQIIMTDSYIVRGCPEFIEDERS